VQRDTFTTVRSFGLLAPVTNWEPHGVTLAGYCYGMRHEMKVQIVTPYRVSHLQRYGVTVRGNVTPYTLRRRCAAAPLLRLWVRIPPGAWMSSFESVVCYQVEVSATS
jgi:hypothetical protein